MNFEDPFIHSDDCEFIREEACLGCRFATKFFNLLTASSFHFHATNTPLTTKLKYILSCFVKRALN